MVQDTKRTPAARAPREEGKEAAVVAPEPGTVYDVFKDVFPHVPFVATQGVQDVILTAPVEAIANVLKGAKEDPRLRFDYLRSLCGVDEVEHRGAIDVVYHLYSFTHKHNVTIKCPVPVDNPVIPSAIDLWIGADWHERETAEMFGIDFEGHPHLVPLLLEEGLNIHPLRKDFPLAEVQIKQGLDVYAFKEQFNWGGSGIEVEEAPAATDGAGAAPAAAAAAAAPAAPRKKLSPEELEAAKARAAEMRAEHAAKKAAGEFSTADCKKRYTPEEIAAIKAKAGLDERPAAPAPEPAEAAAPAAVADAEAPAAEPAAAEPEAPAAEEEAAPEAAAPRRKLTPEEIEEVKKRAAAMRAEHAEKKARGEVSTERKKRYTPEEIEEIKRRAGGGSG